jgi:hypothetical protein
LRLFLGINGSYELRPEPVGNLGSPIIADQMGLMNTPCGKYFQSTR